MNYEKVISAVLHVGQAFGSLLGLGIRILPVNLIVV